jgi:hypothetical protein
MKRDEGEFSGCMRVRGRNKTGEPGRGGRGC